MNKNESITIIVLLMLLIITILTVEIIRDNDNAAKVAEATLITKKAEEQWAKASVALRDVDDLAAEKARDLLIRGDMRPELARACRDLRRVVK